VGAEKNSCTQQEQDGSVCVVVEGRERENADGPYGVRARAWAQQQRAAWDERGRGCEAGRAGENSRRNDGPYYASFRVLRSLLDSCVVGAKPGARRYRAVRSAVVPCSFSMTDGLTPSQLGSGGACGQWCWRTANWDAVDICCGCRPRTRSLRRVQASILKVR
jgi:hypothetical protein